MADSTDSAADLPAKTPTQRHKCSACFKQFKKKEHLVEHMKISYHSPHQPRCGVCLKHCKSLESLREHLAGPLAKADCSKTFSDLGCDICLKVFNSSDSLSKHREMCRLSAPNSLGSKIPPYAELQTDISGSVGEKYMAKSAIAIKCEMVGGGSDGSIDICARVCLVDKDENMVFHTFVQPQIPVTDYRYGVTGLTEGHLRDAMPLKEVQDKILEILYNGESVEKLRLDGGKARLLVGHNLKRDMDCLRVNYPGYLLRDTAKYRPLMRTNLVSHSLKYLTRTYLGYDIQTGKRDPYEDCVSIMRLYIRLSNQDHQAERIGTQNTHDSFESWKPNELENMTSDELYEISRSNYRCWCLDLRPANAA